MYRTIRINLPDDVAPLIYLSWVAARIYNKTVSLIRKVHKKKGFWLSKGAIQKYLRLKGYPLHSQTIQALVDGYFDSLKSYFKQGGDNKRPRSSVSPAKRQASVSEANISNFKVPFNTFQRICNQN